MSKVNLKENIWVEGFDNENLLIDYIENKLSIKIINGMIYRGKTSDIPEKLAKECVYQRPFVKTYLNYSNNNDKSNHLGTVKESIQSACNQEYCIIYRK